MPSPASRSVSLHRHLYSGLVRALLPLAFGRLLWRSRHVVGYRRRWGERLGFGGGGGGRPLWLHAVSVGEVNAALPLIEALRRAYPALPMLVTTTTPTGSQQVQNRLYGLVDHCYLPYDTPGAVQRFFRSRRPRLGIVMETELWPNLYAAARAVGMPLILANARLSPRSASALARWPQLARETLACLTAVAAQTAADGERFAALGLPAERLTIAGNLKFDAAVPDPSAGLALREQLGPGRTAWLAASTHDGEEAVVLDAHRTVRKTHPDAVLILAPRHPQRFADVAALCLAQGWTLARRSAGEGLEYCAVYLVDSLGELTSLMSAADVVFVGGSLGTSTGAFGGHNLIEPAACGKPSLFGPHMRNFVELSDQVLAAGAGRQVGDAVELAAELAALLSDCGRREVMGEAGRTLVAGHRGATARTHALVERYLGVAADSDAAGPPAAGAADAPSQPLTRVRSS